MPEDRARMDDTVGALYATLRRMASDFEFRPGERINESVLSRRLGCSRTPLREALNRLVAEGFLDFRSGQGFFARSLSPERVLHLYEARLAVECEAVRGATLRADPGALAALARWVDETAAAYAAETDAGRLLDIDEGFHTRLCALAGNPELARMLETIYARIRFVRAADLRGLQARGAASAAAHRTILDAVASGDAEAAAAAMRAHITRRRDRATEAVRRAIADIYVPPEDGAPGHGGAGGGR